MRHMWPSHAAGQAVHGHDPMLFRWHARWLHHGWANAFWRRKAVVRPAHDGLCLPTHRCVRVVVVVVVVVVVLAVTVGW